MFASRTTEISGAQQGTLERLYLRRIREINAKLRGFYATLNDWPNADPRLLARYSREEYRVAFVDRWLNERSVYVHKLRDVRRGVLCD